MGGGLWKHEEQYQSNATRGVPLPNRTIDEFNDVFKRIPKNKVGGADDWKPQELLALPLVSRKAF